MKRLTLTVLIFAFPVLSMADTVTLKDGSVVNGTIVSTNASEIELKTPNGKFVLQRDKVDTVKYDEATSVPPSTDHEEKPVQALPKAIQERPAERAAQEPQINLYRSAPSNRLIRIFGSLDIFSDADMGDKFKENFRDAIAASNALIGPTSGSIKTTAGVGVRVGLIMTTPGGFEVGPSVGYLAGPSADGTADSFVSGFGNLHVHAKVETAFTRVLLEARRSLELSDRARLRLGVGAGYAHGTVDETDTYSGIASNKLTFSDSWGGFTWEVSPALVFDVDPVSFEFGLRYASFPKKKESTEFGELEWNPFGIFAGILF